MRKRSIVGAAIAAAVVLSVSGFWLFGGFTAGLPRVETSLSSRADLVDHVAAAGEVVSRRVRDVYAERMATLSFLRASEGDAVKGGEPVMTLGGIAVSAPFSGKISLLRFSQGDTVPAGALVCQFVDDASLAVLAEVPAEDAALLKKGDAVELRSFSGVPPEKAAVTGMAPPARGADGRYGGARLTVALPSSTRLGLGMSVDVLAPVIRAASAVTVPVEAVYEEPADLPANPQSIPFTPVSGETRKYVWALDSRYAGGGYAADGDGIPQRRSARTVTYRVKKVYVVTGKSDSRRIEILEGLEPFVPVVVASDRKLSDGGRVVVVDREERDRHPMSERDGNE